METAALGTAAPEASVLVPTIFPETAWARKVTVTPSPKMTAINKIAAVEIPRHR
jgi:hypothetical protein